MAYEESLVASVHKCVAAAGDEIAYKDQALVDLAMRYAVRIDDGINEGGQNATKALYLGPHLVNALRELGLTPGGVAKAEANARGEKPQPTVVDDDLSRMRARHRGTA